VFREFSSAGHSASAQFSRRENWRKMTTTITLPVAVTKDLLTGRSGACRRARSAAGAPLRSKRGPRVTLHAARQAYPLIFEKPSLRTRVTFEVGIQSMAGLWCFWTTPRPARRARIHPRCCAESAMLGAGHRRRVYEQRVLEEMASNISIPVINALSTNFIPASAGGFFHLEEKFGSLKG